MSSRRSRRALALAAAAIVLGAAVLLLSQRARRSAPGAALAPAGDASTARPPAEVTPSRLPILLSPAGAGSGSPDALPASFEGRVVSRVDGAPVPGAELTFARAGAAASVRGSEDGTFRFVPPTDGRWLLAAVTAPRFFPFAPEWGHSPVQLDARAGHHVRGLEIHLVPAAELAGRTVDERGDPVPGASIRLAGLEAEAALVPIPDRFTSDARGEFRFAAPQGTVVEARKDGREPGRAEVDLTAVLNGRVTVVLRPARRSLSPALPISGRVVSAGGAPVPGALVAASAERYGAGPAVQVAAGDDGTFALQSLDPGRYRVTAHAEGFAPGTVRHVSAGAKDVAIELAAGGRLRGCVRDAASGAPVAPFTVLVFERRSTLWRTLDRSRSVVDASGCYALDGLVPGPAAIVVSAPRFAPSPEIPVEISEGAEAVADAALDRGGRLTGVVLDADTRAPIAAARIAVEGALADAASTFPVLSEASSGADGRFALAGLPPRFSVAVAAAAHHVRILGGLEAPPGATVGPVEVLLHAVADGEEPRVELAGIGAVLSAQRDGLVVGGVRPGGGAAEAGLAQGDLILRVDGRPVEDLGFGGAVDAIRGPEGTFVLLTIRRGDGTLEVRVPRRLVRG